VFWVAFCLELVLGVADLSSGLLLLEVIRLVSSDGVQFSGGVFIFSVSWSCFFGFLSVFCRIFVGFLSV